MAAPMRNAPNTACSPMASETHADRVHNINAAASTPGLSAWPASCSRSASRPNGANSHGPNEMSNADSTMPPTIASQAMPAPAPRLASTTATTHHATASPMAAADKACVAMMVPDSPRSWMMRASTGKAVMAIAAPRNSVALKVDTPTVNSPVLISQGVTKMATMKGTTMPDTEIASAPFAFDLKSSLRKSMPTRNMYSAMP